MIAILKALAAAISGQPEYTDRPFDGPFVTIHAPAPKRPSPYDWAKQDDGRDDH